MSAAASNLSVAASWSADNLARQGLGVVLGALAIAGCGAGCGWLADPDDPCKRWPCLRSQPWADSALARVRSRFILRWARRACRFSPMRPRFRGLLSQASGFFLFGFLAAAALNGYAFDKGAGKSWIAAALTLLIGSAVIYLLGVIGMMRFIGFDFGGGNIPFATYADVIAKVSRPPARRSCQGCPVAADRHGVARGLRSRLI